MALYLRSFFIVILLLAKSQKIHTTKANKILILMYLACEPEKYLSIILSLGILNDVKGAYSRLNGK